MSFWPNNEPLLLQLRRIMKVGIQVLMDSKLFQLIIMHNSVEFICKSFFLVKSE